VASTKVDLTISDPEVVDSNGKPIRIIRRTETNLGDLCADAYRDQSGADIAFVNGGGIRVSIEKGDITYGDIIAVHPFGNMLTVIEVSGQQILDALEWGAKAVPGENGGFIQVSGLTYEIDATIDSPCVEDDNSMFVKIKGKRRVSNVMVGDKPIDPKAKYTLAGHDYMLLGHGDGFTMFDGATVLQDRVKIDNQVLIDYITDTLGGTIGEEYAEPFGEGRIVIKDSEADSKD
jgi:2',3'-cyclic-nucleotide 2'-phosphodiesterase (5'-nucleotidase family)